MIRLFALARLARSRPSLSCRFSYKERVSDDFLQKLVSNAPTQKQTTPTEDATSAVHKRGRLKKEKPEDSTAQKMTPPRRPKPAQPEEPETAEQPQTDAPAQSFDASLSSVVETVMEGKEEQADSKRIPKQHEIIFEKITVFSEEKRLIESQYGVLRVPNQLRLAKLSNIYYLVNSTNVKFVKKVLKNDPGALLLFPPTTHEKNARLIFEAIKAMLFDSYYGQKAGNPFRNCKGPNDIFHLARRISLEISMQLRKIGVVCTATGDVLLKGENHKILDMEALSNSAHFVEGSAEPGSEVVPLETAEKFYKRDLFLPLVDLLSLVSQQNMQTEGVKLEALSGKKLYCRRGVWPPTHDRLFKLFKSFVDEKAFFMKEVKGVLEVGCGSGVLTFIALQQLNKKEKVHCFDLSLEAVKTVQMNKNILDLQDRVNEFKADVNMLASFDDAQFEYFAQKHHLPLKFELILANPPWINARPSTDSEFENGNFDHELHVLTSTIKLAAARLQHKGGISQKDGTLLLLYSDLSANLGLTDKKVVEDLSEKHGLKIRDIRKVRYTVGKEDDKAVKDPILVYKNVSSLILYEITRK